jgi:chain length determinant protein tyrosine kinase EpsG
MISAQQKTADEHGIGAILVDSGRLKVEDATKILLEQKISNIRFGEAGIKLGLLNQNDIDFVLARQFDYQYLNRSDKSIDEEIIAAFSPFSPIVEQLRAVRTQLMLRWFDADTSHKSLAIVSPSTGDGRSFVAANLAVVFSQLGERTLLIDADLRHPRQHELFKISNSAGLSAVLTGRAKPDAAFKIKSLLGLTVLPAGACPPNPQELLSREVFTSLLAQYSESFDVIIIDTPASENSADAQTISARTGAALLVASKNFTQVTALKKLAENLESTDVSVVGSLLNEI